MTPAEIQARVLHRDGLVIILDKPAGIAVHGGPGGGDNLERHFPHLRYGLAHIPALAHRLDRDTSGCLALGRHPKALSKLGKLFQSGRVEKTYWAVVLGAPPEPTGRICAPLLKKTLPHGWRMVVDAAGQTAATRWTTLGAGGDLTWLELTLETGRTHQIRVHLAHLGCPVMGDPIYGWEKQPRPLPPTQLHARRLILPLAASKPPVDVTAPVPPHMRAALTTCGWPAANAAPTPDTPSAPERIGEQASGQAGHIMLNPGPSNPV